MQNNHSKFSCITNCQNIFDELTVLDSVLYALQNICNNLESNSEYYLEEDYKIKLCEERNRYIALLTIARDTVKNIQDLNNDIEDLLT